MSETADKHLKFLSEMMYASLLSAIMRGPDALKETLEKTVDGIVKMVGDLENRRCRTLDLAVRYGGIAGDHHKAWVIDQMVRKLAAEDYERVVADARAGEDGSETYTWDEGIAP